MSRREWIALCVLAAIFGAIAGWSARIFADDHRYIRSLTERHEAAADYFNEKTDQMISANKPKGAKE